MDTGLNTETLIIAIACLGLGVIIGILIARALSKQAGRAGSGGTSQRQEQRDLAAYQNQIGEHFVKTADLLQNLDASYGQLRQHLAGGAAQLATPEISHQFTQAETTPLETDAVEDADQTTLKAPLDYAPGNGGLRGD